jgi:DnaJ-domain-containing protein 1
MELDYRALTSQNLETLLQRREWSAFLDIVESIAKHLEVIKQKAIRIQRSGDTETKPDAEGRRDKAFRILGVSPTTTKNEIEKMLRHLRKAYHPDSVVDEEKKTALENKLKEIEWAANVLEVKPISPTS